MSQLARNLGRLDATGRLVFVPVWLFVVGWLIHHASVDWTLTLVTFGGFVTAYMLITGALHVDPLYEAYGLTTRRPARERRAIAPGARRRPQG